MHDVIAHRISLVSVHAGALEYNNDAAPAEVARSAAVIRASAHEALQDLRTILGVLRAGPVPDGPDEPDRPQPTLADLVRLVEESRQAGMKVTFQPLPQQPVPAPADVGRTAYRVVQEALTNARKHAPGTEVTVALSGAAGDGLSVEVSNPWPVGRELTAVIPGGGLGLAGLGERASVAGGRLDHGRTPDGGFRVRAWLPWPT
jgi:signal transduction histidine kinase